MRIRSAFIHLLLAITVLLPASAEAARFTVFYSNDVHGEIEPCG